MQLIMAEVALVLVREAAALGTQSPDLLVVDAGKEGLVGYKGGILVNVCSRTLSPRYP
jgi:hypothetical protein